MKKTSTLPDFKELCIPEQNHIADHISLEFFFFFVCSFIGFLWEVLLMYVSEGKYINRGFFYGPWLPVYGVGGVLYHLLLGKLRTSNHSYSSSYYRLRFLQKMIKKLCRLLLVFFLAMLLGAGVELFIGWFVDTFWGLRYWDYSDYPFDFHGYICLVSALGFGAAGVIWVCFLSNFIAKLWLNLPIKKRRNLNTILFLLFVFDCAAALIFPNTGTGITFP